MGLLYYVCLLNDRHTTLMTPLQDLCSLSPRLIPSKYSWCSSCLHHVFCLSLRWWFETRLPPSSALIFSVIW